MLVGNQLVSLIYNPGELLDGSTTKGLPTASSQFDVKGRLRV